MKRKSTTVSGVCTAKFSSLAIMILSTATGLPRLLRFNSSALAEADDLTSLEDYMGRAPEAQKTFWFVTGPNREACRLNPHMELFRKKGVEVLYLFEPIDEFVMDGLGKYKEWEFRAVENAGPEALKDFEDKEKSLEKGIKLTFSCI